MSKCEYTLSFCRKCRKKTGWILTSLTLDEGGLKEHCDKCKKQEEIYKIARESRDPKNVPAEIASRKYYYNISDGYVFLKIPKSDPFYKNSKSGIIAEHRYIMGNKLGRPLHKHEKVHHKNGVRHDNTYKNLELWTKDHPCGQRVEDLIKQYLMELRPEYDKDAEYF